MANTDDDTVIYFDPSRSKELTLCQSYGEASDGYGLFKQIETDWLEAMRFYGVLKIKRADGSSLRPKYIEQFPLTPFANSEKMEQFEFWGERADKIIAKALSAGLVNQQYISFQVSHGALIKALVDQDYSVFENLREYRNFSSLVSINVFIGFVAVQRIYSWLIEEFRQFEVPNALEFVKTKRRLKIDEEYGIKGHTPTLLAQEALDCLVKLQGFYQLCSAYLVQVLSEISILTSPLTNFPQSEDEIPDTPAERHLYLLSKLHSGEVYEELGRDQNMIINYNNGLRLYSLYSRHYYLGYKTELGYTLTVGEDERYMEASIPTVQNYLEKANELLKLHDISELKYKVKEIQEHNPTLAAKWDNRFRDFDDLQNAFTYINDIVHSIGYLECDDDDTWSDVTADLLSKLIELPPKMGWIEDADGPIQELEYVHYGVIHRNEVTNSADNSTNSLEDRDELIQRAVENYTDELLKRAKSDQTGIKSNHFVCKLAEMIESVDSKRGCILPHVGHALMGDVRDKSTELRNWLVNLWGDAQYARKKGAKTYPDKRPPITSPKYQELVKLWDEDARTVSLYECKEEYTAGAGEILEFWSPKSRSEAREPSMRIATWLVENVERKSLERQMGL